MENELTLTARGHAICELMLDQRLTLDDACARLDWELETLHQQVALILSGNAWEDVAQAMQRVLDSVSLNVQAAYFEEQRSAETAHILSAS